MKNFDLVIVMPVYNEEDCIAHCIQSWIDALSKLSIRFQLIVLNDGSTDGTASKLKEFSQSEVYVLNKDNEGHGPTILHGYNKAVKAASWVFQCDSDQEISPIYFSKLWENREQYDALFGVRVNRQQGIIRRCVSMTSQFVIKIIYGHCVRDVNTPYRLMRSGLLKDIISQIPSNTLAPNIIIAGVLSKDKFSIYELPVVSELRKTGASSLTSSTLFSFTCKALCQTLTRKVTLKVKVSPKENDEVSV